MRCDPHAIIGSYDLRAGSLADQYEAVAAKEVNASFADLIPRRAGVMSLDIGAGSGRDAAWLGSLGHEVVAVEPSAGMRGEAERRHSDTRIRWADDRLPGLDKVMRLGLAFDLILLNAVWMHVSPGDRPRAFRKLASLLKPGGLLVISLRHGPPPPDRAMWDTPVPEVEALARDHGLAVQRVSATADALGRADVTWTTLCLTLPDDGSGGLPLLRGVILNDVKSATYKLALLRAIAKVADTTPGLAALRSDDSDIIDVPLGAVAMNWLRMYLPLVNRRFPQAPRNTGPDGLSFARDGFRALERLGVKGQNLRVGAQFSGDGAQAVGMALIEARDTIVRMPSRYITYPNSNRQIFEATPRRAPRAGSHVKLDQAHLAGYGNLAVPGTLWRALQRLGAWVEPVIVAEWARLMRAYGEPMGLPLSIADLHAALTWLDPVRDTALARAAAARLQAGGQPISCVWTGTRLTSSTIDIDHCLPWAAWPCGDLWNLLPASRRVNQHLKRNRLPSAAALSAARDGILLWWHDAWLTNPAFEARFADEARAALPVGDDPDPEEVFAGLEWRRLRLKQDQQVEEWAGRTGFRE